MILLKHHVTKLSKVKYFSVELNYNKFLAQWTEIRKMKIMHQAVNGPPSYGERRQSRRLSISAMARDSRLFNAVLQATPPKKLDENENDDENDFFDMSWPKDSLGKQVAYVFLIGITGPLWLTLPDVRREGKEKWVPVTFIGSIVWIGFFRLVIFFSTQAR